MPMQSSVGNKRLVMTQNKVIGTNNDDNQFPAIISGSFGSQNQQANLQLQQQRLESQGGRRLDYFQSVPMNSREPPPQVLEDSMRRSSDEESRFTFCEVDEMKRSQEEGQNVVLGSNAEGQGGETWSRDTDRKLVQNLEESQNLNVRQSQDYARSRSANQNQNTSLLPPTKSKKHAY